MKVDALSLLIMDCSSTLAHADDTDNNHSSNAEARLPFLKIAAQYAVTLPFLRVPCMITPHRRKRHFSLWGSVNGYFYVLDSFKSNSITIVKPNPFLLRPNKLKLQKTYLLTDKYQ